MGYKIGENSVKHNILSAAVICLSFAAGICKSEVICMSLRKVSAGEKHTLALAADNSLWACGSNEWKQAGFGRDIQHSYVLKRVKGVDGLGFLTDIAVFDAGWYHSLAADVNGNIYSWGTDNHGQLGNGPGQQDEYYPAKVKGIGGVGFLNDIVYLSAGRSGTHSLAVNSSGYVYAWGNNEYGQCGDGAGGWQRDYPVLVLDDNPSTNGVYLGDIAHIVQVDAGEHHSIALSDDGRVWHWGDGSGSNYPVRVKASSSFGGQMLSNIIQISSYGHSIALDSSGCVWEWTVSNSAYKVPGGQMGTTYLENIAEVRAGFNVSMARTNDGRVLVWNASPSAAPSYVPKGEMQTASGLLENITAIDAGGYLYKYQIAISQDGSGWAWGRNPSGELGVGDDFPRTEPARMLCPVILDSNGIIYVDKDAAGGFNNGTSWDNAYTSFADALREADIYVYEIGDCEIWVAGGTYKPLVKGTNYSDSTFKMPKGNIVIRGHFGGIGVYEISPEHRDFNNPAYETILDGKVGPGSWDKAQYTVTCANLGKGLVLDGFTFTGASQAGLYIKNYSDPSVIRCKFNGNSSYGIEAIDFSYPDVSDCVFLENGTAGISSDKSAWPYVKNCLFDGNYNNYYGLYGIQSYMLVENCVIKRQSYYGMYFTSDSYLIMKDCKIENNKYYGVYCTSNTTLFMTDCKIENNNWSGIYCTRSDAEIFNCTIQLNNNHGIMIQNASNLTVSNNIIRRNKNNGIHTDTITHAAIKNNWIYLNGTSETHSGIYLKDSISPLLVRNNTIVGNYSFGVYIPSGREPNAVNNIIWDNGSSSNKNLFSQRGNEHIYASYNCISGGWSYGGTGNIDADPCFRDASANDYHLKADSPCINAGDPNGDYEGETDIDGRKRVIYKRIDIGADEWANPPDYNLDGFVNFIDYSMFAQAWLTEDSDINLDEELIVDENDLFMFAECWAWSAYRSKADLNSDNIVNFRDFALFAEAWDGDFDALAQFCKDWLWVFTWD